MFIRTFWKTGATAQEFHRSCPRCHPCNWQGKKRSGHYKAKDRWGRRSAFINSSQLLHLSLLASVLPTVCKWVGTTGPRLAVGHWNGSQKSSASTNQRRRKYEIMQESTGFQPKLTQHQTIAKEPRTNPRTPAWKLYLFTFYMSSCQILKFLAKIFLWFPLFSQTCCFSAVSFLDDVGHQTLTNWENTSSTENIESPCIEAGFETKNAKRKKSKRTAQKATNKTMHMMNMISYDAFSMFLPLQDA